MGQPKPPTALDLRSPGSHHSFSDDVDAMAIMVAVDDDDMPVTGMGGAVV
jgi:hypothetical protein